MVFFFLKDKKGLLITNLMNLNIYMEFMLLIEKLQYYCVTVV